MKKLLVLVLVFLASGSLLAASQEVTVTQLFSKDLQDVPGKELTMIEVEYAPGGADPVHRHDAHGLVYVLEGSIVM
ncbi:MAG: cupin, partial [Polyangiaceae bacterium]